MYIIKCKNCNQEDRTRDIYELYCNSCENDAVHNFEIKEWKLHKLFKPEIMEKIMKIEELFCVLSKKKKDTKYLNILEKAHWNREQEEYKEILKLKMELVKYFEWCHEKFGRNCLENMYYNFDDYCYSIRKHLFNPITYCELSDKIFWIN